MLAVNRVWLGFISLLVLSSVVISGCGTGDPRGSGRMIAGSTRTTSPAGMSGGASTNPGMSPEEIGQQALEQLHSDHSLIRVLSGTPEVILARWVTPDELAAFTSVRDCWLATYPQLVLVVFKGDFELDVPGATLIRSTESYAFKIFDQDGQNLGWSTGSVSTDESYQEALVQLNAAASASPKSAWACGENTYSVTLISDWPGTGWVHANEAVG